MKQGDQLVSPKIVGWTTVSFCVGELALMLSPPFRVAGRMSVEDDEVKWLGNAVFGSLEWARAWLVGCQVLGTSAANRGPLQMFALKNVTSDDLRT